LEPTAFLHKTLAIMSASTIKAMLQKSFGTPYLLSGRVDKRKIAPPHEV
jgi:hypothetical protein